MPLGFRSCFLLTGCQPKLSFRERKNVREGRGKELKLEEEKEEVDWGSSVYGTEEGQEKLRA